MNLTFYYTPSENNKIVKALTSASALTGTLREICSIEKPEMLVHASSLSGYNYAYIPQFNRYYFITEVVSYRNDLWLVRMLVDPLMSFKNDILKLSVILQETETTGINNYLADNRVWFSTVKDKTDIINFPNGLLNAGEYILITAGGGGST